VILTGLVSFVYNCNLMLHVSHLYFTDYFISQLWRINETYFNFRVFHKLFVGLEDQGNKVTAFSDTAGNPETFQIVRKNDDRSIVRLQASNGQFLQVLPYLSSFFLSISTFSFFYFLSFELWNFHRTSLF